MGLGFFVQMVYGKGDFCDYWCVILVCLVVVVGIRSKDLILEVISSLNIAVILWLGGPFQPQLFRDLVIWSGTAELVWVLYLLHDYSR